MKTITLHNIENTQHRQLIKIPNKTEMDELAYIVYGILQKYPCHSSMETWARQKDMKIDFLEWKKTVDYLIHSQYVIETVCYKGSDSGLIDNKEVPASKFTYIESKWLGLI
jgi:hypothetical protein